MKYFMGKCFSRLVVSAALAVLLGVSDVEDAELEEAEINDEVEELVRVGAEVELVVEVVIRLMGSLLSDVGWVEA